MAATPALKCPVCKEQRLVPREIAGQPASHECEQCHGQWIESACYWEWLEANKTQPTARDDDGATVSERPVNDSFAAKLCPECGHFLARASCGHGVGFMLDRCGACGGIWFDANEWESLHRKGLTTNIHLVFSEAWQASVAREQRRAGRAQMLSERLGATDFAELERVKQWIEAHPHRAEIYALLLEDAHGISAPARLSLPRKTVGS